jgi:hypothetical protein
VFDILWTMGAVMIDFLLAVSMCAAVGVVGWAAVEIERHLL